MLSSYFLEVRTGTDYSHDEYDSAAGRLVGMLVSLLSDKDTVHTLTYGAERETCHSEIEVSLEEGEGTRELVAKVVVDMSGPLAIKFDKGKWTKLVKAHRTCAEWPNIHLRKKMVPLTEDQRSDAHPGDSQCTAESAPP